jgi:hypothetical protein
MRVLNIRTMPDGNKGTETKNITRNQWPSTSCQRPEQ